MPAPRPLAGRDSVSTEGSHSTSYWAAMSFSRSTHRYGSGTSIERRYSTCAPETAYGGILWLARHGEGHAHRDAGANIVWNLRQPNPRMSNIELSASWAGAREKTEIIIIIINSFEVSATWSVLASGGGTPLSSKISHLSVKALDNVFKWGFCPGNYVPPPPKLADHTKKG